VASNPCQPSPCGPNAECRVIRESPSCSCLPEFLGTPPNCRPECVSNSECASNLACINRKCKDPCPGTCGLNAECRVVSHTPNCVCLPGFFGDPFLQCNPQQAAIPEVLNPCNPSPCGINAECKTRNGAGSCICLPEYLGNPYEGCRPECSVNTDCPSNKACLRNRCQDPCPGTCGPNAICQVINHLPTCSCNPGFTGDPFRFCNVIPPQPGMFTQKYKRIICNVCIVVVTQDVPVNPCQPSPCGPNSQCREVNEQAVCSCLPNYFGTPPSCRPECTVSTECARNRACINQKCADPCPGTCGLNTICNVVNHSPICSCKLQFTGDPFSRCYPIPARKNVFSNVQVYFINLKFINSAPPEVTTAIVVYNPCVPSPCGPNSECREINGVPSCSCLPTYIGSPPNCRPECSVNSDCISNLACINEKCRDPCPGSCGASALCTVTNHIPICTCPEGLTGDPFSYCTSKPPPLPEPVETDPCNPSPCGPNAQCNNGICTCLPEYQGDPYRECRPECVLPNDCPRDKTCIRNKCRDPCPGTCGQNAQCVVVNHIPICTCLPGFSGNAFLVCSPIPGN